MDGGRKLRVGDGDCDRENRGWSYSTYLESLNGDVDSRHTSLSQLAFVVRLNQLIKKIAMNLSDMFSIAGLN